MTHSESGLGCGRLRLRLVATINTSQDLLIYAKVCPFGDAGSVAMVVEGVRVVGEKKPRITSHYSHVSPQWPLGGAVSTNSTV